MADSAKRISVGFKGGQVLALRVTGKALDALESQLGGGNSWHLLETEDGPVRISLDEVVYLRSESDEPRVGFGS